MKFTIFLKEKINKFIHNNKGGVFIFMTLVLPILVSMTSGAIGYAFYMDFRKFQHATFHNVKHNLQANYFKICLDEGNPLSDCATGSTITVIEEHFISQIQAEYDLKYGAGVATVALTSIDTQLITNPADSVRYIRGLLEIEAEIDLLDRLDWFNLLNLTPVRTYGQIIINTNLK